MLIDASKYNWSRWTQPIFDSDTTWGSVSASSVHDVPDTDYAAYHALDENADTHWESNEYCTNAQFIWIFDKPLKIYRIELINKPTSNIHITKSVEVYADEEMTEPLLIGEFPNISKGECNLEPEQPFSCDRLILNLTSDAEAGVKYDGLSSIRIIAEVGEEKTVLTPFLNTIEDMEAISTSYNDDGTFTTSGLEGFMFNGIEAATMYISSNLWFGLGTNAEQLKVMRRDACSTAIYRQLGTCSNGLDFLKLRFEGYTVYNSRVDSNRIILELFLLGNNDMFLNVIQTPTSGNTGTSELVCNNTTTQLNLVDSTGAGGGTQVSFYHQDEDGRTWNIIYAMYENTGDFSFGYLLQQNGTYYFVSENELVEIPIETLTAAMFLKYGFEEIPPPELLTPLINPHLFLWKAGGESTLLKATLKAYPYPQIITSVIDMSHISILGIKLLTAQFSGEVGVCQSLDNGETFSEEVPLSDWLNTDPDELYNSLNETRILILHFVLHDNATISRFKITYIN